MSIFKVGGKEDDLDGGDGNPYTDPKQTKELSVPLVLHGTSGVPDEAVNVRIEGAAE